MLLAVEHLLPDLRPCWRYLWDGQAWGFVDLIAETGAPLPGIVAPAFFLVSLLAVVSLVLGLITRVSAVVLTGLAVLAFSTAYGLGYAENALLYLLIFGAIVLLGPGVLSLDAILTYRKPPKPMRPLA